MNKMPSPVDEESATLTNKMRKGVENKGQDSTVCKCEDFAPTDLKSAIDKNGNEETENVKNSSKAEEEGHSKGEFRESEAFIMTKTSDEQDFIVTFSCSQCICLAHNNSSGDKKLREKRKQSKRCVCLTICTAVIFCLSVISLLFYLFFNILSQGKIDNRLLNPTVTTVSNSHHQARISSQKASKTYSTIAKFELDVEEYNPKTDKVLPWVEQARPHSNSIYHYDNAIKTISVLRHGDYFIQVTLNADTTSVRNGDYVTILPCITYKTKETCQRIKIPSGMSYPIHLQDVVRFEPNDTVKIKVLTKHKNCIYTTPHHNILTIVQLH